MYSCIDGSQLELQHLYILCDFVDMTCRKNEKKRKRPDEALDI